MLLWTMTLHIFILYCQSGKCCSPTHLSRPSDPSACRLYCAVDVGQSPPTNVSYNFITNYNLPKPITASINVSCTDAFFLSFSAIASPRVGGRHTTHQNPGLTHKQPCIVVYVNICGNIHNSSQRTEVTQYYPEFPECREVKCLHKQYIPGWFFERVRGWG